jgi:large subunit ribosomal protein L5
MIMEKRSESGSEKKRKPASPKAKKTEPKASSGPVGGGPPRLKDAFRSRIMAALMQQFSYRNSMQVPRLEKIVVNVGMGEAIANAKLLDVAVKELALITGQQPLVTTARKSIAAFKLRAGMPVGCKVTLRGDRMYEFLDRLVNVALPRLRDFKGLSPKGFDGCGNYTFGLKEQLVFPEIHFDEVSAVHGMDITLVTTAQNNEEGRALLHQFGIPFRV